MRPCAAAILLILSLGTGCDLSVSLTLSTDSDPPPVTADVVSDPATDGDVREDGQVAAASVVFCGFDPRAAPPVPEHRGFLSFPLDGIPTGAIIESAILTFTVDRVDLPAGIPDLILDLDRVHYGGTLGFAAFSDPGTPVGSLLSGVSLTPAPDAQRVTVDVVPELQADANDPFLLFFQVRVLCSGGLAQIVDGAGNRAEGVLPDRNRGLAPVLSVRYR
ncbi:MAG: hypothetical protein WBX50_09280 [Candidatus Deferrimicrobiaceae bacterium]